MSKLDPTSEDIKRFHMEDAGGPFVMLNLLKFKPDGGAETYSDYAEKALPHLRRVGAEFVYVGHLSTMLASPAGETEYDAVALVRYPSRQALHEMIMDPEYQKIAHIRAASLDRAILQATTPGTFPGTFPAA